MGTAANSQVDLVGGAQACNVFWQVGTSATLGATSHLAGTIIASASITMGATVTIDGRALAVDGAVTMIGDTVHAAPCTALVASTAPSITPFTAQLTGRTRRSPPASERGVSPMRETATPATASPSPRAAQPSTGRPPPPGPGRRSR